MEKPRSSGTTSNFFHYVFKFLLAVIGACLVGALANFLMLLVFRLSGRNLLDEAVCPRPLLSLLISIVGGISWGTSLFAFLCRTMPEKSHRIAIALLMFCGIFLLLDLSAIFVAGVTINSNGTGISPASFYSGLIETFIYGFFVWQTSKTKRNYSIASKFVALIGAVIGITYILLLWGDIGKWLFIEVPQGQYAIFLRTILIVVLGPPYIIAIAYGFIYCGVAPYGAINAWLKPKND